MIEPALEEVTKTIVRELAEVTPDEDVLVLTDVELEPIARSVAGESRRVGAETVLSVMKRLQYHGNEPPEMVAEAMKNVDIVFAVLATSLTHTNARRGAAEAGARTFILRGVDFDTMTEGGINTNYEELTAMTASVHEKLADGETVTVTSPAGTDITMDITDRVGFALDGSFQNDVDLTTGVPQGEAPIAPVEGTAQGTVVIDYSMDNIGRVETPIVLEFEDGYVTNVDGGDSADRLSEIIADADEEAGNLAEFAIGTNPDARLTGILAEDKKAAGTVHFAVGDNMSLGGTVSSNVHLDGMVLEPTVVVDGETIVKAGNILV